MISKMKKTFKLLSLLLASALTLTTTACGDDDAPMNPKDPDEPTVVPPDKPIKDPDGTIVVNLRNDDDDIYIGDCGIAMNDVNNFRMQLGEIADIGEVAGLGNVTTIPESGWTSRTVVVPGHGYVLRRSFNSGYPSYNTYYTYARLYATEYLLSTSGGIIGVQIKYQTPFEFPIKLETTSVIIGGEEENCFAEIAIVNNSFITIKSQPEWIQDINVIGNKLTIQSKPNYVKSSRSGKIIINNTCSEVEISVTQNPMQSPYFEAGDGTEISPYQINTAEQFDNIRKFTQNDLTGYFVQTADFNLKRVIVNESFGWEPIPNFKGCYDGQMHKITGLWINMTQGSGIALFSEQTDDNSIIKRIRLELDEKGIIGYEYVAGIVGKGKTVEECSVKGNITATTNVSYYTHYYNIAAGIMAKGTAKKCAVEGTITSGCYTYGISGGYAENCYIKGNIIETKYSNHRYPFADGSANCFILTDSTEGLSTYSFNHCYMWTPESGESMYKSTTYAGWDFSTIWKIDEGKSLPSLRCFK